MKTLKTGFSPTLKAATDSESNVYVSPKAKKNNSQQGFSLLSVILVVAVITFLASSVYQHLSGTRLRTAYTKQYQQATWFLIGARDFALDRLTPILNTADYSHPNTSWQQAISIPLDQGSIKAKLSDAHNCFNINSLYSSEKLSSDGNNKLKASSTQPHTLIEKQFLALLNELRISKGEQLLVQIKLILHSEQGQLFSTTQLSQLSSDDYNNSLDDEAFEKLVSQVCALPTSRLQWNINSIDQTKLPYLSALLLGNVDKSDLLDIISSVSTLALRANHELWQHPALVRYEVDSKIKAQLHLKPEYYHLDIHVNHMQTSKQQHYLLHWSHGELNQVESNPVIAL